MSRHSGSVNCVIVTCVIFDIVFLQELREILSIFSDLVHTVRSQSRSQELRAILSRYAEYYIELKFLLWLFITDGRT